MKFYDTHFSDYIKSNKEMSLHPKLTKMYADTFPKTLKDLKNIIFYGPKGVGKYTQMLSAIKRYSPSELKYEKKISVSFNKSIYFFKISDIHFEIDMSILGCNSKLLWNEIYNQIIDIILAKTDNTGIIVCKYFHDIHSELLDSFYSYMQTNHTFSNIKLTFILVTEELSFMPDNILNCCKVIHVPRPSRLNYNRCLKHKTEKNVPLEDITNIKNIQAELNQLMQPHAIICDKIIADILHSDTMKFMTMRDNLYDIFIYNLNVSECIWYILHKLIQENKLKTEDMSAILMKTYTFLQYYNNNYRPIYHLENYVFFLTMMVYKNI
jgi:DNA polymerase III delta prime subunit